MNDQYTVGYGKPPKKSQFQKGKSGNPKGRPEPKPLLDSQKILIAELKSTMPIKEAGKKKEVPKLQAFWKIVIARALQGDKAMAKLLLDSIKKLSSTCSGSLRVQRSPVQSLGVFTTISLRRPPLAGFLRQVERLCVPNSMILRPNMPKISAHLRHCSRFSGETSRRLGSIALRHRVRLMIWLISSAYATHRQQSGDRHFRMTAARLCVEIKLDALLPRGDCLAGRRSTVLDRLRSN